MHRASRAGALILVGVIGLTVPAAADPPASVTYTYDDAGRLRSGTISDGTQVDYQYDPAGNRTVMSLGLPAQLSIGAPASSPTEGQTLIFPVTRTGVTTQTITVDCVQTDGTAESTGPGAPFDDYTPALQQISFPTSDPNPSTKNCSVVTKQDAYYEGHETVNASLQSSSVGSVITPGAGSAIGSIGDDDPGPSFSVSGDIKTEGSTLVFTMTKSGLTELSHNVTYASADGTATLSDSDYTSVGAVLSFSSALTSQLVNVATASDTKYELSETISMNLSVPTNGASIAISSAAGTLTNDDAAPSFTINDRPAVNEGQIVTFTVTKISNTNTALSHSFSWATANGSAAAPADFDAASGTIDFQPSDLQKTIQVQTRTDGVFEGSTNETFTVNLSTNGGTNGATLADAQGQGEIADLDNPFPSVPTNLRTQPPTPIGAGGVFSVVWDASTGPVSYYTLEELRIQSGTITNFTINAPTTNKAFSNKTSGEYEYRVKACSAGNQCSAFTSAVYVEVCNPECN